MILNYKLVFKIIPLEVKYYKPVKTYKANYNG